MIFIAMRWVEGDAKFYQTLRQFATQYAGKSASLDNFRELAEKNYGDKLTWFFSQWFDSTGAPEFKAKYTVYRLGNNKGFRVVGEINQDLDLFRMPVDLKIETEGNPEEKRVEVVGTSSEFSVDTFMMGLSARGHIGYGGVVFEPNGDAFASSVWPVGRSE